MSGNEPKFGELKEKPMREFWAHEAHDFTPWLAENISELGEALGMELRVKQTEHAVGRYSLDILAEEVDTGRVVAIENQFHQTDHSHLGQLLTYAAGCDSDILIWIVEEARDEHRAAVEWLNRKTDTETHFYLVQVKIWQIGDSLPAYQFIPIVASNKWEKEQHQQAMALSPKDKETAEYFAAFAEKLRQRGFPYFPRKQRVATPRRDYWCVEGVRKWSYSHAFPGKDYWGDVFIQFHYSTDHGVDLNKIYQEAMRRRKDIGDEAGIVWDEKRHGECIFRISAENFNPSGKKSRDEILAWAVESIIKLSKAVPPEMLQEISDAVEAESE